MAKWNIAIFASKNCPDQRCFFLADDKWELPPGAPFCFIPPAFFMNKSALVKKIVAELTAGLELYTKAARTSRDEATHEQNKAENKYDTRGLEASYLARGQSKQITEMELAIEQFEKLIVRDFGAQDPVDLGAFVELEGKGEHSYYFIGPRAGGTEIVHLKKEILVITPQSPLGQQLVGKKQGDRLQMDIGGSRSAYKIASVL